MQPQSSKSTGRKSRSMETCGRSRRKATTPSISSAADSHAKTSASQEKVPGLPEQGPVFGTSSLGSLASYVPDTSSWKTSQLSLLEEWTPFSGRFPRSGMTRNGTLFQLRPLVRRTGGSGSGSLPTPTARDWRSGKASQATHDKNSRPLSEQIGGQLNPTWVEWLMGFPLGWTALDASETPSSRKSSKSSGGRSSRTKKETGPPTA